MRITTGRYKGRILSRPEGIRPTQNKVRKALFDILGDIEGLSLLELFAGSGAVGLEAASRGAKEVIFVEKDKACVKTIQDNLSLLGCLGYRVIGLDAPGALKKLDGEGKKFDIIFLDPPYYQGIGKKILQTLGAYGIVAPNGFIIVQHFSKDNLPEALGDLALFKQYKYGDTVLSLYKKNSDL